MDFSYNHFTIEEAKIISNSLKRNHTIYGFHFNGHYGYVDNLGFFIVDKKTSKEYNDVS